MATSSILTELVIEDPKRQKHLLMHWNCPVKIQYAARLPRSFPY